MTNKTEFTSNLPFIMTAIGWILLLGLVGFLFKISENHEKSQLQKTVTSSTGETEFIIEMNRGSHYVVQGDINGKKCEFLLDTGATYVAVPESFSEKAGMIKGPRNSSQTANGVIEVYDSRIQTLHFGPFELHDVTASITPDDSHDTPILLGMSALKRFHITQLDNKLILSIDPVINPSRAAAPTDNTTPAVNEGNSYEQ